MPNYRRAYVPGGTYFFTVIADRRMPIFDSLEARNIFGNCFRECRARWPFEMPAAVLLPDHLHAIWSLPSGDTRYSIRWSWLKKEFTKRWIEVGGCESEISQGRKEEASRHLATVFLGTHN